MVPVKNGFKFYHSEDRVLTSSDLWGCARCKRFQIHGFVLAKATVGIVKGRIEQDPGNPSMYAITDPDIVRYPDKFTEHMNKFYDYWGWNKGGDETGKE